MAVTENDRWALAFDVGVSVFNWKDTVKEALEEVCMVAVHPSDLLAAIGLLCQSVTVPKISKQNALTYLFNDSLSS